MIMIILAVCFCPLYGWYDPFIKERVVSSKTIGLQRVIQGPIMLKRNKIQRLVVRKVTSLTVIQVLYINYVTFHGKTGEKVVTCAMIWHSKRARILR